MVGAFAASLQRYGTEPAQQHSTPPMQAINRSSNGVAVGERRRAARNTAR